MMQKRELPQDGRGSRGGESVSKGIVEGLRADPGSWYEVGSVKRRNALYAYAGKEYTPLEIRRRGDVLYARWNISDNQEDTDHVAGD